MRAMLFTTWLRMLASSDPSSMAGTPMEEHCCAECLEPFQNFQLVASSSDNAANEGLYVHNTDRCNPGRQEVLGKFYDGVLVGVEPSAQPRPPAVPAEIPDVFYA